MNRGAKQERRERVDVIRRLIPGVAMMAVLLTGCAQPNPEGAGIDLAEYPEAQVAVDWTEEFCNGQLTAAQEKSDSFFADSVPQFADHVAAAQPLFEAKLEELADSGVDVTPQISVVSVIEDSEFFKDIYLEGSCYGMPFKTTLSIMNAEEEPSEEGDGSWLVADAIPYFQASYFINAGVPDQLPEMSFPNPQIETGYLVEGEDPSGDFWFLPPGDHTINLPAHFTTGDATERTITVDPFQVTTETDRVTASLDSFETATDAFLAECGALCLVQWEANQPAHIEPVEPGTITYSGEIALVAPSDSPAWVRGGPRYWGHEFPDTARGYAPGFGTGLRLECSTTEPCTFNLTTDKLRHEVTHIDFIEYEGTIQLAWMGVK